MTRNSSEDVGDDDDDDDDSPDGGRGWGTIVDCFAASTIITAKGKQVSVTLAGSTKVRTLLYCTPKS